MVVGDMGAHRGRGWRVGGEIMSDDNNKSDWLLKTVTHAVHILYGRNWSVRFADGGGQLDGGAKFNREVDQGAGQRKIIVFRLDSMKSKEYRFRLDDDNEKVTRMALVMEYARSQAGIDTFFYKDTHLLEYMERYGRLIVENERTVTLGNFCVFKTADEE